MSVYITSITGLEQFVEGSNSRCSKLYIFAKNKGDESISSVLFDNLFKAYQDGSFFMEIMWYETQDELMFRLGSILNKDESYVLSDGLCVLPDYILSEYHIEFDKSMVKSKPVKVRNTRGRKSSVSNKVAEVVEVNTEPVSTSDSEMNTLVDDTINETVDVHDNVDTQSETNETMCDSSSVAAVSSDENNRVSNKYDYSDDILHQFVNMTGISLSEISNQKDSIESLANSLLCILQDDTNKTRIRKEIVLQFGSDLSYLFGKIEPHLSKLHAMACVHSN